MILNAMGLIINLSEFLSIAIKIVISADEFIDLNSGSVIGRINTAARFFRRHKLFILLRLSDLFSINNDDDRKCRVEYVQILAYSHVLASRASRQNFCSPFLSMVYTYIFLFTVQQYQTRCSTGPTERWQK